MRKYLNEIPEGYSIAYFQNKKYGISKTIYNRGNSIKIYAEELSGNDYISLNYYFTQKQEYLKPCEMPMQKVITFFKNLTIEKCKK